MKTLQELRDPLEIRELSLRYNQLADAADGPNYARLFTADGELHLVGNRVYRGPAELAQACEGTRVTAHITTDATIVIDGDSARQRSRLLAFYVSEDHAENDFVCTGWYIDELVRTADGWRISKRTIQNDLELPKVLQRMKVTEAFEALAGQTG